MQVHEHTGVSFQANDAAYTAIVNIVQDCLQQYKVNANEIEVQDIAYINAVLAQFAITRDVNELINEIKQQDTYVREYFEYIVNDLYNDYFNGEWE